MISAEHVCIVRRKILSAFFLHSNSMLALIVCLVVVFVTPICAGKTYNLHVQLYTFVYEIAM